MRNEEKLVYLSFLADQVGSGDQLNRVSERGLFADLGEHNHGLLAHLDVLFLAADLQDLLDLVLLVRRGRNDEQTIEQIDGYAVRALIVGAANARDATIGGHDEHGCHVALQSSIQKREALDVEHVHFVDEEHAGHDLGLAFLAPFGHLQVNLIANL